MSSRLKRTKRAAVYDLDLVRKLKNTDPQEATQRRENMMMSCHPTRLLEAYLEGSKAHPNEPLVVLLADANSDPLAKRIVGRKRGIHLGAVPTAELSKLKGMFGQGLEETFPRLPPNRLFVLCVAHFGASLRELMYDPEGGELVLT